MKIKVKLSPETTTKVKVIEKIGCLAIHQTIDNAQSFTVTCIKTGTALLDISIKVPLEQVRWLLKLMSKAVKKYLKEKASTEPIKQFKAALLAISTACSAL